MTSRILLENIKIFAYHGVLPEETILGTYFLVNATVETDLWRAAASDDLRNTVNYAEINEVIHQEMAIPSQLMEHVAGRIIERLGNTFPQISAVQLRITKTSPPMRGEMHGVSVELEKKF